jgi:hypothetical protein
MSGIRPTRSRSSAVAASIALTAAAVLSGCSSSTSGSATSPSSSGSSSAAAATAASSSAASKASGGGGGGVAGIGFCREATLAQAAQTKAARAFNVDSRAALQKIEQQGLTELHALTATAPSAIKGSLSVLVAADEKLYSALQAADFDVRKVDPTVLTGLNTPEFTKATQAIGDYLTRTCGIKVSPSA